MPPSSRLAWKGVQAEFSALLNHRASRTLMGLEEKPESGVILEFQTQYYPLLPFLCILAAGENVSVDKNDAVKKIASI